MIIRVPPMLTNKQGILKYVEVDLWSWLRQLTIGLLKINFKENFQSFIVQNVSIPAGQEIAIANQFRRAYPGLIPTQRIIVRQQGDANIIDGTTAWTESQLYLLNPSANDAVITVVFLI